MERVQGGMLVRRETGQAALSEENNAGGVLADGRQGGGAPWVS